MNICVIIPARLASSRLPEKALADIHGKPMIVRVAEQAMKAQIPQVIVACDDVRIQEACTQYGVQSILTGTHHTSGTTRLAQASQLLNLPDDTIVVNVQGDEPLIPPQLIASVAQNLINSQAAMATAAHPVHDFAEFMNPNCVKVVLDKNQNALYFSRAPIAYPRDSMLKNEQKLPENIPLRHIGIYAYRVDFLKQYAAMSESPLEQTESLEQLRVLWHGFDIAVEVLDFAPPAGVDTAEDLQRVRRDFQAA